MRIHGLTLLPLLCSLACGDDTTATATNPSDPTGDPSSDPSSDPSGDTTSPTSSPTGSASDSSDDSGSATTGTPGTDTATSPSTSDDTGTTSDSGTTSNDSATSEESTGTDTAGVGCGEIGPQVEAHLVHDNAPPACGPVEFIGSNYTKEPGPVYQLDGCPCNSNCLVPDPWQFTLDVPAEWSPGALPDCPRIVVERMMSKAGCELVGLAIWDSEEPEGSPAVFHAGSLLGPIEAVQKQLGITASEVETCDCGFCCDVPTRLDLHFSALDDELTLGESATGQLGQGKLQYDVVNFQSHISGLCDDSPAIDWVMRRSQD